MRTKPVRRTCIWARKCRCAPYVKLIIYVWHSQSYRCNSLSQTGHDPNSDLRSSDCWYLSDPICKCFDCQIWNSINCIDIHIHNRITAGNRKSGIQILFNHLLIVKWKCKYWSGSNRMSQWNSGPASRAWRIIGVPLCIYVHVRKMLFICHFLKFSYT